MTQINIGNPEGEYFRQWRVDLLIELLGLIRDGIVPRPGSKPLVDIPKAELFYDRAEDFHRLEFTANGHDVKLRFYIKSECNIDGEDRWSGCPENEICNLAASIRRAIMSQPKPVADRGNNP